MRRLDPSLVPQFVSVRIAAVGIIMTWERLWRWRHFAATRGVVNALASVNLPWSAGREELRRSSGCRAWPR
jgi:hypothetical protein